MSGSARTGLRVHLDLPVSGTLGWKKEEEDVVEEGGRVYFAHLVVSATHDDQTVVCGQVFHAVAKASDRGSAAHFKGSEFAMNHFLVNSVRFKQSEAVLRFALRIFSSEEVDAFEDCIRLKLTKSLI